MTKILSVNNNQNIHFKANPLKKVKKLFSPRKIERQVIDTFETVPKGLTEHKKQTKSSIRCCYEDPREVEASSIEQRLAGTTITQSILSSIF